MLVLFLIISLSSLTDFVFLCPSSMKFVWIFLYDENKIAVMHRFREYVHNAVDLLNLKEHTEFYNS